MQCLVVEHLLKSTANTSRLLYYSSLVPVYQFLSQRCVALALLCRGYLHLSLQVCFLCFVWCVFLWSLLRYTAVISALFQLFVFVVSASKRCLLMFLCCLRRSEDRKPIPRRLFKQISHARQSCKMSQQILDICHQAPIHSLFKPPSGILWSELSAFPFIHCSHNKLVLFSSLLLSAAGDVYWLFFWPCTSWGNCNPARRKKKEIINSRVYQLML